MIDTLHLSTPTLAQRESLTIRLKGVLIQTQRESYRKAMPVFDHTPSKQVIVYASTIISFRSFFVSDSPKEYDHRARTGTVDTATNRFWALPWKDIVG